MQKLTGQYKNTGRHAAFFDLDGTLIRGDSQAMEARYILGEKPFSLGYLRSISLTLAAMQLYKAGLISLTRQNEIYLKTYRGMAGNDLNVLGQVLFDRVMHRRLLSGSLAVMERHRTRGDMIVLVSATTRHLIRPFERVLNPDRTFCTDLEYDSAGRATGRAENGICAQDKKEGIVRDFARERGVEPANCHAYSDHESDIPFLSAAGHPHAVNPTRKLAAYARKMDWTIHWFD